jgi:hypothetical protein
MIFMCLLLSVPFSILILISSAAVGSAKSSAWFYVMFSLMFLHKLLVIFFEKWEHCNVNDIITYSHFQVSVSTKQYFQENVFYRPK